MWTSQVSDPGHRGALRFVISRGSAPASYAEVLEAWRTDGEPLTAYGERFLEQVRKVAAEDGCLLEFIYLAA